MSVNTPEQTTPILDPNGTPIASTPAETTTTQPATSTIGQAIQDVMNTPIVQDETDVLNAATGANASGPVETPADAWTKVQRAVIDTVGPELAQSISSTLQVGLMQAVEQHSVLVAAKTGEAVAAELAANRTQLEARLAAHSAEVATAVKSVESAAAQAHIGAVARVRMVQATIGAIILGILAIFGFALLGNHTAGNLLPQAGGAAIGLVLWLSKTGLPTPGVA